MKYTVLLLCLVGSAAALVSTNPRSRECKAAGVYTRYVFVQTVPQLQAAVADVKPGDMIELRPGNYTTFFTIDKPGTSTKPIKICGPASAKIQGDFRFPAVTIRNSEYIIMSGFTVARSLYGVLVKDSNLIQLQNLVVQRIGYQGIVLRKSTAAAVEGTLFSRVGIKDNSKGQGIWVDRSPDTQISKNNIIGRTVTGSMVLISQGSDGSTVSQNTFGGWNLRGAKGTDSWVDIRANFVTVTNNTGYATPRDGFRTSGKNNVFQGNRCFMSWNSAGVCINVDCDAACQDATTVSCSNSVTPGSSSGNAKELTNIKVRC